MHYLQQFKPIISIFNGNASEERTARENTYKEIEVRVLSEELFWVLPYPKEISETSENTVCEDMYSHR